MRVTILLILGSISLFWGATPVISSDLPTFKIAAIDWCPQICPREAPKGYVVDIVNDIYKDYPVKVQIDYFPWSRAIKYVNEGVYDALLSPAKQEAPNLLYPKLAVGSQQMCFFSLAETQWVYYGERSLKGLNIGVAKDTSIEELNSFLISHAHQFQFQPYHDRYVEQNYRKLKRGRIDTFLFTMNTTLWELRKLNVEREIRVAGCVKRVPIYLAFTPSQKRARLIADLINKFDMKMYHMLVYNHVAKILENYQLNQHDVFDVPITIEVY